jgi:hypothetical protein
MASFQGSPSAEYICGNDLISLDLGFGVNLCLASGAKNYISWIDDEWLLGLTQFISKVIKL